jgi:hypothetical protein
MANAFLLLIEAIILIGGWGLLFYGGAFALSGVLTENQLGLLVWTVGIGVMVGWIFVVLCMIAPALNMPIQSNC